MLVRIQNTWLIRDAAAGNGFQVRDDPRVDEDNNGKGFHLPFLTFAVIAIAVVIGLLGMVILRIFVLQRRYNTNIPQETASSVVYNIPTENPPPIYEHKVLVASDTNTKLSWNDLQPISVAFDRAVTSNVRLDARGKADTSQVQGLKPPNASVQTTFIVGLPTPAQTVFPPRLRRRSSHVHKKSMETDFPSQRSRMFLKKDAAGDADDFSQKPQYAPSIHSNLSQKEQGDARREAYFYNLDSSSNGNSGLEHSQSVRMNLSHSNQAILNRHDTAIDNDEEVIGAIALGTMSMQVKEPMENKDDSCVPLTKEKLSGILHHAKKVRDHCVSKV